MGHRNNTVKPFLFLDVDGVLNALGGETDWGDTEWHYLSPGGHGPFILSVSKRMAQAINDLDCEIVWTTTWRDYAPMVGDLIGIRGGVIPLRPGRTDRKPWKRGAVEHFIGKNPRPFVWFEDDPGSWGTCNKRRDKFPVPHIIINPHSLFGITPRHIDQTRSFLSSLTQDVAV